MRLSVLVICCYLITILNAHSQIINAYSSVTTINAQTITLSNVNESFGTFEDGDQILVYQTQDSVVSNLSNTVGSGTLGAIRSAGLFEVATILSHTETAGIPTSVTLTSALSNTYETGINSSLQIISFPNLGSPNFTTTATIRGLAWDGNVGGVVAFQVTNRLTLNHAIDADEIGFRGGEKSRNASGSTSCTTGNVVYVSNSNEYGEKGEGIYKNTNVSMDYGRGIMLNGGGGGTHHNGGGAGGSNQSTGGAGGSGYNGSSTGCPLISSCGGVGGIGLNNHISTSRMFLGGGGGGGQQNNNRGSDGEDGGGFIFIKADSLVVTNCTTPHTIHANGGNASSGTNDGMGGGGAGGSILLDINHYDLPTGCTLDLMTNGGDGGNANTGTSHAGGGGGGQGAIRFLSNPPSTVTATSVSGTGGCNNSGCSFSATNGGDSITLLAIELLTFEANYSKNSDEVALQWETSFEFENQYFRIFKSTDGFSWEELAIIPSLGNSTTTQSYSHVDDQFLSGNIYYKLEQVDMDEKSTFSPVVTVYIEPMNGKGIRLGPNPTTNQIELSSKYAPITNLKLYSLLGEQILIPFSEENNRDCS